MVKTVGWLLPIILGGLICIQGSPGQAHQYPEFVKDRIKELAQKPVAKKGYDIQDRLTGAEARDAVRANCFAKVHVVQLAAGHYQIDLMSGNFDPYLRLEGPAGQRLAEDDDSGSFPNSRLFFQCTTPGAYRLIVTTFAAGATGDYRLTVQEAGKGPLPGKMMMPGKGMPKKQFKFEIK